MSMKWTPARQLIPPCLPLQLSMPAARFGQVSSVLLNDLLLVYFQFGMRPRQPDGTLPSALVLP